MSRYKETRNLLIPRKMRTELPLEILNTVYRAVCATYGHHDRGRFLAAFPSDLWIPIVGQGLLNTWQGRLDLGEALLQRVVEHEYGEGPPIAAIPRKWEVVFPSYVVAALASEILPGRVRLGDLFNIMTACVGAGIRTSAVCVYRTSDHTNCPIVTTYSERVTTGVIWIQVERGGDKVRVWPGPSLDSLSVGRVETIHHALQQVGLWEVRL